MKPSVIHQLTAPLFNIGARILNLWASRLEAHGLAFNNFGIRIVAPKDTGTWDNHDEAYTALVLLKEFDEEKFELVKKHIHTIFLHELFNFKSGYVRTGQVCVLDIQKFSECPSGTIPITIAGILVYFASFAKFDVPFGAECEEIKKLCDAEQEQIVDKLEKILCE